MRPITTCTLSLALALGAGTAALAEEGIEGLPRPHYHREAADPAWLAYAAQFHGHIGPWATSGLRAGMAARRAVGAQGYFDVRIEVEGPLVKPPHSCFLDGLQISSGATLGKRNLEWKKAEKLVVRATNTKTGKTAEVRPTPALLELIATMKPDPVDSDEHQHGEGSPEAIARRIAAMPQKELFTVTIVEKE